jgi:hypothetical protein
MLALSTSSITYINERQLYLNKPIIMTALGAGLIVVGALIYGVQAERGTISGKVTIGPLCPVEPCPNPDPEIYTSRQLILQSPYWNHIYIQLGADGSFRASVSAGTYTVGLTDCTFLGCERSLPITVAVSPNGLTTIDIHIDTGIR